MLNISRMQLLEEGILGPDLDFEISSRMGCGEAFEGVAVAAQMYHAEGVRAFIGPYCNAGESPSSGRRWLGLVELARLPNL